MDSPVNYLELNRQAWNNQTDVHMSSDFYDMPGFLAGNTSLKEIELRLLGDVKGKSVLHLQCHFGQDTVSLARMGALVMGIDLSDKAIERAKELALQTQTDASFIACDIYDLPQHLDKQFDIVFTSYGTIGWLPDMDKWAGIVSKYLAPGGKFVFVEFHPLVWMLDEDFKYIKYDYFNTVPIIETESGTYADRDAPLSKTTVSWNHDLGEVLGSLIKCGLELRSFDEHDYSPYNCFRDMEAVEPGKYRIGHLDKKIPMVYALTATKRQ
ncbi:MAG: methyltransferase type 12 [Bacteroidetes bacterium 46-16]|nr:MAG: methyltransferase type 12 [Bacteroidetes bacterium 46-16]